ncbi:sigma-70 family RNA polymerase sigma factor [soil metagenome]
MCRIAQPECNIATPSEPVDALVASLYDDLRRAAKRELRRAGSPQTWQTTAIINEAWLKLHGKQGFESHSHLLAMASTTMRHIMVDAARARLAARRNGGVAALPLEAADDVPADDPDDHQIIKLGEALKELAQIDPELAQLVDCRYFAGLSEVETGKVMGVTDRTVRRRWIQARAWIHREMLEE